MIKVSYVVGNSIGTTHTPLEALGIRELGPFDFPGTGEIYAVQMFHGMFGHGLFIIRSVDDDRIMRRERHPDDPPITYKAVSSKPFIRLLAFK